MLEREPDNVEDPGRKVSEPETDVSKPILGIEETVVEVDEKNKINSIEKQVWIITKPSKSYKSAQELELLLENEKKKLLSQ